jgi:hypothetical protein
MCQILLLKQWVSFVTWMPSPKKGQEEIYDKWRVVGLEWRRQAWETWDGLPI